jgi:hypothetical protein
VVAGTGLRGWAAGIIIVLPLADELSAGKSWVDTEPSGWPLLMLAVAPIAEPGPLPPISAGGTKRLSAESVRGIDWFDTIGALALTELVVVRSKPNPPRELHPESAVAPTRRPKIAAVLYALPVTRLLISPLYAGTQWT